MTSLTATVPGVPQPQGSIRSLGKGRPSVHSNADRLLPWRGQVIAHLRRAMDADQVEPGWPISGPVAVSVVFALPKPRSAPRSRMHPDRKPDIDKLARAVLDCLGSKIGAGVIFDDAQVVQLTARKTYGGPGCVLTVSSLALEVAG